MTMESAGSFNLTNKPSPGDIAQGSVVILLGILVGISNFLTVLVVHKFRSVSNPDILILGLAIIDFISAFTVFPMAAYWYLRSSEYPRELCIAYGALTTSIQLASTVIVSLMTVDRFLAIRRPILYRTRLGTPQIKRIVGITVIISAAVGCLPAALSATNWTSVVNRHGYCTFKYSSNFTYLVLVVSLPQIPILLYCYYGFLVSIRKFVQRRQSNHAPSPSRSSVSLEAGRRKANSTGSVPSSTSRWGQWAVACRIYCCCCCCVYRTKQMRPMSRDQMVERTQAAMRNLNLKRWTRMSKTVALVVVIYYIPWLLALITMLTDLVTKSESNTSTLNLVMVRLLMAHSIFYPMVYATLCNNYRQAYKWAISLPFHPCGLEWHERPPLGLTVSEMHRISHQMALEEWESPGLNRRLYSKRPYLKRTTTDSLKGVAYVKSDTTGQENPGYEGNEMTSSDHTVEEDGHIAVAISHENTERRPASDEHRTPSVSVSQQTENVESPRPPHRARRENVLKQGCSAPRRQLENQTSDSGVDVDSIHLDSAPSGSNSPAVIRLQTVESESSTSMSDVTERLPRVEDKREEETSFISHANQNDKRTLETDVGLLPSNDHTNVENRQTTSNDRIEQLRQDNNDSRALNIKLIISKDGDHVVNDDDTPAKQAIECNDVATKTNDVNTKDPLKPIILNSTSDGYIVRKASPRKNSIFRIESCPAGEERQGMVQIHVEVVELRPDSIPADMDSCSLQSQTRECHLKSTHQRPSFKFDMQKNRFVPCTSSFEEIDSFSLDFGDGSSNDTKGTLTVPRVELMVSNDATTSTGADNNVAVTDGDVDERDDPPAKGLTKRRMRASRALRQSARYDDDIVRYSEAIMRRQRQFLSHTATDTHEENKQPESPIAKDGPEIIVTDNVDI